MSGCASARLTRGGGSPWLKGVNPGLLMEVIARELTVFLRTWGWGAGWCHFGLTIETVTWGQERDGSLQGREITLVHPQLGKLRPRRWSISAGWG